MIISNEFYIVIMIMRNYQTQPLCAPASGRTAPLTVEIVAPLIAELAHRLDKSQSGGFVDYTGETIPF